MRRGEVQVLMWVVLSFGFVSFCDARLRCFPLRNTAGY